MSLRSDDFSSTDSLCLLRYAAINAGGTRVDSFIYSNSLIPSSARGSSYDGIMHVSDWFPTILDLADITYTAPTDYTLDGVSQKKGWFKGSSQNGDLYIKIKVVLIQLKYNKKIEKNIRTFYQK
jgi:hypothetical protein